MGLYEAQSLFLSFISLPSSRRQRTCLKGYQTLQHHFSTNTRHGHFYQAGLTIKGLPISLSFQISPSVMHKMPAIYPSQCQATVSSLIATYASNVSQKGPRRCCPQT